MQDSSTPAKPVIKRSLNNTAQAKYITDSSETLAVALDSANTDIGPILSGAGYDSAALAVGKALATEALRKFGLRQTSLGTRTAAQDLLDADRQTAHDDFVAYKTIARASFKSQGDRIALSLTGDVPDDFELFITTAHTAYIAGTEAPYTAKLTLRGYSAARLTALAAGVNSLANTDADVTSEEGDAIFTTAERNEAYRLLQVWMSEFRGVALGLFRKNPAARHKLKL